MEKPNFKFWHSFAGTVVIVVLEYLLMRLSGPLDFTLAVVLIASTMGAIVTVYVATEVIEEVHGAFHMIALLTAVVIQFVLFFAFQYLFILLIEPASFPTLLLDPSSLVLHSVMAFVFNPLYMPATAAGRTLLLIQTFGALGLVLFVLQNISEFRRKSLDRT